MIYLIEHLKQCYYKNIISKHVNLVVSDSFQKEPYFNFYITVLKWELFFCSRVKSLLLRSSTTEKVSLTLTPINASWNDKEYKGSSPTSKGHHLFLPIVE